MHLLDVAYMQRALLAGLLLSVPLGLLGAWVVIRRLAFFSHAVGVATFPGLVAGIAIGGATWPWIGALAAGGGFAATVSRIERDPRLRGGAVTGLVLAGALALGAVLLTTVASTGTPVEAALFGSLLGISTPELVRAAVVSVAVSSVVLIASPRLAATSFDGDWAASAGARGAAPAAALAGLIALAVVTALPAVGSLLVSGLLVVPAATARLVTRRIGPLLAASVGVCAAEVVAGLFAARLLDAPPGAAIATLGGLVFGAVAAVARREAT